MKKFIVVLLILSSHYCFSQTLPDFDNIRLEEKSDYAAAEPSVLQASNYILNTPFEKNDLSRLRSLQFIIKWMTGTPDFGFTIDEAATKIAKGNDDLLGIYMACMTKYCLENKAFAKDNNAIKLNSINLLIDYCDNPNNHIKLTKQLKKLSEAKKKGELEKEL